MARRVSAVEWRSNDDGVPVVAAIAGHDGEREWRSTADEAIRTIMFERSWSYYVAWNWECVKVSVELVDDRLSLVAPNTRGRDVLRLLPG